MDSHSRSKVEIYTDGGCEPNPGAGGFAAVLLHPKTNLRKEVSGGFRKTTNNRMELMAAIKGLETLKEPCDVTLYSDSKYLVDAMRLGWAAGWKKKNWWRTNQDGAENFDLWDRLLELCEKHQVTFEWVRGHAGNAENECCDRLSCAALKAANLEIDEGYENKPASPGGRPPPKEGEPCWKCSTPVVKQKSKPKPGRDHYYEYYLWCPKMRRQLRGGGGEANRREDSGDALKPERTCSCVPDDYSLLMDVEHVRRAVQKQPFQPFTIRLSDGRAMKVGHPEFVATSPSLIVVIGEDGYGAYNIDPFLVVSIDHEGEQKA